MNWVKKFLNYFLGRDLVIYNWEFMKNPEIEVVYTEDSFEIQDSQVFNRKDRRF